MTPRTQFTLGDIFRISLSAYRQRFRSLMGISLVFLLPFDIINAYVQLRYVGDSPTNWLAKVQTAHSLSEAIAAIPPVYTTWMPFVILLYSFGVLPLMAVATSRVTVGMVVHGFDVPVQEAGNDAFRKWPMSFATLFMAYGLYGVAVLVASWIIGLCAGVAASASQVLGVIVAVIGLLAALVGSVWYWVRMAFVPYVIAEEKRGYFTALRRSFEITRGETWRLVGFFVALSFILSAADGFLLIVGSIFAVIPGLGAVVAVLASIIVVPFSFVAVAVMYIDLRMRKA
ncbi:hypothetical protein IW967_14170 [Alicyclobacillus mali]|uniref:Membrane domain of glycerophosphoryl diester phosphodiesterase n=1 Tax=Alicyclobacillus mali (ex Roth et al. 2021) TaxID=1123961 RepID=A0ABS0F6U3_9BACL|nr:hypothetical protein [Alicyclobacillus mali (ex Roth et al. 2021)]MBF8378993.1 hypothetical protein [Alicyclobacillus mali (ex Roth et al. 2021)]